MKNISLEKISVFSSLLMSSVGFNCAMQTGSEQNENNLNI